MRKLLALAALASTFVAVPAEAEHSQTWYKSAGGVIWLAGVNPCVTVEFDEQLDATQEANARDDIQIAMDRWRTDTQFPYTFNLQAGTCGNFNFVGDWNNAGGGNFDARWNNFCSTVPSSRKSSWQYENLNNTNGGACGAACDFEGYFAITLTCDTDGNSFIDYFTAVYNTGWIGGGNGPDLTKYNGDPGTDRPWDFLGSAVHEFGHATGVEVHFTSPCALSDGAAGWQTMCGNTWGLEYTGSTNGKWARSLETHDIGEANDGY